MRVISGSTTVVPTDLSGAPAAIVTPTYTFSMSCPGHKSMALSSIISATQNTTGVVVIEDAQSHSLLSAVGILFNPKGGAHTTIPAALRVPSPIIM